MEADTILCGLSVKGRGAEPAEHSLNFLPEKQLARLRKRASVEFKRYQATQKPLSVNFRSKERQDGGILFMLRAGLY
jgi:hypothetical protein